MSYKYTYAKTTQIQRIEKGKLKSTQGYRRWAYSSRIAFGNAVRVGPRCLFVHEGASAAGT